MSPADAPHREPPRDSEPSSSRDQRIEQLLIAGLDRYFAGELERAIQVWSRVFFLDRGHPRARAYIDRARGAIAERQREAEARGHRPDGNVLGDDDGVIVHPLADLGEDASAFDTPSSLSSPVGPSAPLARDDAEPPAPAEGPPWSAPDDRPARSRAIAQALLVALAALLLFGAGYVVAARDRLAGWWAPSGEPELAVPAMAPESGAARPHEPPAGSATPTRGTATR
jgi:hypothetical protein